MAWRVWLVGIVALVTSAGALAVERVVGTAAELEAALDDAPRGLVVRLRPGEYLIERPLIVPNDVRLVGKASMTRDPDGWPEELTPGTAATLRAGPGLAGDLLTLGDGTTLQALRVVIPARRVDGEVVPSGNAVVVASRRPGDRVAATIRECEIVTESEFGANADGPTGRGLVIVARNPGSGPAHEGAHLQLLVEHSVVRARLGNALFVNNFAARAETTLEVRASHVEGMTAISGGTSRPYPVDGAIATFRSIRSRYRSVAGGWDRAGWFLFGASGVPFPSSGGPAPGAQNVRALVESDDDRIEGFRTGVHAVGYRRVADYSGPGRDNRLDLHLRGTRIATPDQSAADLVLLGVTSDPGTDPAVLLPAGERNQVVARFSAVRGSGERSNEFLDRAGPPAALVEGDGNRVQIEGSPAKFELSNPGLRPLPPESAFARPD
jgi:hypothetical protein